jgi:hypothetical protein
MEDLNFKIERPVYNEVKLQDHFHIESSSLHNEDRSLVNLAKRKLRKKLKPSMACLTQSVVSKLPVIDLVRTYQLKYLLKDVISGLTVGIIQIAPSAK